MDEMSIGPVILDLRKKRGMTQERLAEAVGVSPPAVSKWETGASCPDVALLAPIARMLAETTSRVPFSDWYDTKTGRYQAFIARSVQGGVFAPMLRL